MNQKTLIWGGVVILVAVIALWYFGSSNMAAINAQGEATTTSDTTAGTTGTPVPAGSSTFRSIFTQSGNHECDYSQTSSGTQGTSVIYISGGKMRGEFRATVGGTQTASLMIYSGGYLYSWKEGATTGKKSSIKTLADLPEVIPQDLTSGAVLGTASNNVGWICHDWLTDPKVFTIPTYVTFSAN